MPASAKVLDEFNGLLCSGGDLNPILGFCFPPFSMVFSVGISIRLEICGREWNENCGFL
jgi:hypothetical protein